MASATGIPAGPLHERGEDEPLLGGPGDATQQPGRTMVYNLVLGTGFLAQIGIVALIGVVWGYILPQHFIFFNWHPLLNSVGLLVVIQGILILQPIGYKDKSLKTEGAAKHQLVQIVGVAILLAGLVFIEVNKVRGGTLHFKSPHAIMGLVTYVIFAVQALAGLTMRLMPALYGGEAKARSLYKLHRASGYALLLLALATVCAATYTDHVQNDIGIRLWQLLVPAILIILGVYPRIKLAKLGV